MSGQSLSTKLVLLVVVFYSEQMSGDRKISKNESNNCSCVGDTLTFECTVMTGRRTIWNGSAFNCASTGNEINLFNHSVGDQTCNSGIITGRVIKHERNNYTSQLNVVFSTDLIGRSIECASDNGSQIAVCNTMLDISPFPPPEVIFLDQVNFGPKELTFSWSPVAPGCSAIHYNILASNCGSCPTITNHTIVTCIDIPTDDSMCSFAIQTAICGNITGNWSKPLMFNITDTITEMIGSKMADTISISIITVGVSALLVTIVIVILTCSWLLKRNATLKTSSRLNEPAIANSNSESSSSLQSQTNSRQGEDFQASHDTKYMMDKDIEYSQLEETPVNLKRLLEKLQGQISKQWYQLGLTLGLPMDVLEGFNLYSEDDCLIEVLDYWLKHHPGKPTWQEITDAQKKVEIFNTEQDAGAAEKKVAVAAEVNVPPKKPPRRTSSVTMKKPMNTETTVDDIDHEYEVIH